MTDKKTKNVVWVPENRKEFLDLEKKLGDDYTTLCSLNISKTSNYDYPSHFVSLWDDFTHNIPSWKHYLSERFKGKDDLMFLELGTAQGRASVWLLEEILTEDKCSLITVELKKDQYLEKVNSLKQLVT